ncbi:MAG: D-tyrosyl-tRNA(Tyr) deacylase [Candidatus Marinimicrobia bacterium]|nr:D-tyrosyl-tRNA(Tyr) deacylase [Candidatus Neomarinimicrobiota bacterium]
MIAVLQRASHGKVTVDNKVIGEITHGLVIFVGAMHDDDESDCEFLTDKIAGFRIFNDENGKMNKSILEVDGSALVISQFTLCGDWRKGRRPSFTKAAPPEKGRALYENFILRLGSKGVPVQSGEFGAMMEVELVNDGPVTFVLDSKTKV